MGRRRAGMDSSRRRRWFMKEIAVVLGVGFVLACVRRWLVVVAWMPFSRLVFFFTHHGCSNQTDCYMEMLDQPSAERGTSLTRWKSGHET